MSSTNTSTNKDAMFGKFLIPSASIFYRSPGQTLAFVNLRPIVLGHVLVMPSRIVPVMQDLSDSEYTDLWLSVRAVQRILQSHYGCDAFNVSVQDGRAAGQSVPHVHVHILPRFAGDLTRNDDVYARLEEWAPRDELKFQTELDVPEDEDRRDRTREEMAEEAEAYRQVAAKL